MITQDNLKEVLADLHEKTIVNEVEKDGDYVNIEVHSFNAGWYTTVESVELPDDEVSNNGNLSIDKDDFLRLLEETDNLPEYYK